MDKITTTIKREWLRTIADRTKRVGYREIKPYWVKRLSRVKVPFQLRYRGGPSKIGSSRRLNNSSNRQNPCKHWHHNDSVFSANRFVPVRNSAIIWDVITPANAPNDRGLAVFGEFFLDLVLYDLPSVPRLGEEVKTTSFARFPGGGLATTALVASHLGTPTRIITIVGQDALPTREWQKLVQSGVSTRGCEFHPTLPTAMTVCAAFDGDRMMITYDKINRNLEALLSHKAAQAQIRSARHLHLACAMAPPGKWARLIRKLRHTGIGLSADLGWNPETLRSPQLPSLLRELEFTFPNESEAKAMTGERTVEAAARELARWVRVPVLKLGVDGCLAVADGKVLRVKSIRVRSVDATGSGDAFNGGFLHGHLAGWPLEDCLRAGNVCGALAATKAGGSSAIPTRKKLRELMKKIH